MCRLRSSPTIAHGSRGSPLSDGATNCRSGASTPPGFCSAMCRARSGLNSMDTRALRHLNIDLLSWNIIQF